jgi:hypothetical protein
VGPIIKYRRIELEKYLVKIVNSSGVSIDEVYSNTFSMAVHIANESSTAGDKVTIYEGEEDALGLFTNPLICMAFTQDAYFNYDRG